MVISGKNEFNKYDWAKALQNAKLFLAPLALIYLGAVVVNVKSEGFQVSDFKTDGVVAGAMVLYVANFATDLVKKFLEFNKYPEK